MRVTVDRDRCDSNGLCTIAAPDVFELDDEDLLHIHDGRLRPEQWAAVEEAARSCPKLAIALDA